MSPTASPDALTLTFLACGTLSSAILSGVLSALEHQHKPPGSSSAAPPTSTPSPSTTTTTATPPPSTTSTTSTTPPTPLPSRLPSKFIACVKRPESAERIRQAVHSYNADVDVLTSRNVQGVTRADVVVLGCKPWMCAELLTADGMPDALRGKLLVSICAGVRIAELKALVPDSTRVVRVMPNTASKIREGMSVIAAEDDISPDERALVEWIFAQVGRALVLAEKHMDVCTALGGSGPAFYALMLESMTDGAVMMGLPRPEAQLMAAQVMRGTGEMVLQGQAPALIREQVSTPGGCTIAGILKLEDAAVRASIARTIQEATNVASGLGKK